MLRTKVQNRGGILFMIFPKPLKKVGEGVGSEVST